MKAPLLSIVLPFAQASPPPTPGATVCFENYTSNTLEWYTLSASYAVDSSLVSTGAGAKTCQNLGTFVNGGAQQDMDYYAEAKYLGPSETQYFIGIPNIQYDSSAGTVSYACGIESNSHFCCCIPGNTSYWCFWESSVTYSKCVLPPTTAVNSDGFLER